MSSYIYIFGLTVSAILGCGLLSWAYRHYSQKKHKRPAVPAGVKVEYVRKLLQELNCQYQEDKENDVHCFCFKFQNGTFLLKYNPQDTDIFLHYPNFLTVSAKQIDAIREACNYSNAKFFEAHTAYTINAEEYKVNTHIISALFIPNENPRMAELLGKRLALFFQVARDFYLHFQQTTENQNTQALTDTEKEVAGHERDFTLLKELEMHHFTLPSLQRADAQHPLTLQELVRRLYHWEQPEWLELKIVTHELNTLVTEEEIAGYDISRTLIADDTEGNPNFTGTSATLIVMLYPQKERNEGTPMPLNILLQSEGCTRKALYLRATCTMPPIESAHKNSQYGTQCHPESFSFRFAYDKAIPTAHPDLESLIKSTEDTVNAHNGERLSRKEIMIYLFEHPVLQQNYDYAKELLRQERYYEAIVELEYLYRILNTSYMSLPKKQQDFFHRNCYWLALCYSKLHLYQQALFYLDIILPLSEPNTLSLYVDCLVNSKDFRANNIIDQILEHENKEEDQEEAGKEDTSRFVKFLYRRKAQHLIDLGEYALAKRILQLLYKDPENQDFALNELAYLQSIGALQEDDNEEDNAPDHSSTSTDNN